MSQNKDESSEWDRLVVPLLQWIHETEGNLGSPIRAMAEYYPPSF